MARTLIKTIVDTQLFMGPDAVAPSSVINSTSFLTISNSPTLTFTPTVSGKYKVYATPFIYSASAGAYGIGRIFNTTGGASLISEGVDTVYGNTGDHGCSMTVESVYTLTAGTSYSFDIQLKSDAGASVYAGASSGIKYHITAEKIGS